MKRKQVTSVTNRATSVVDSTRKQKIHLGFDALFNAFGITMKSRNFPVRQYNKDKPEKFRLGSFILKDSIYYFIYHLDVYQGKSKANIDTHPSIRVLPNNHNAVANGILKSGIDNEDNGSVRVPHQLNQ